MERRSSGWRSGQTPDQLIAWFRWGIAGAAAVHLALFQEAPALVVGLGLVAANLVGYLPHVRSSSRGRRRVAFGQVVVDLAVTVYLVAVVLPAGGVSGILWVLLLLPVSEAAVRGRLRGALATWVAGALAVHLLADVGLRGNDLASQLAGTVVAIAIGLLSEVLEARLVALAETRAETDRRAALLTTVANAARSVAALETSRVLEAVADAALELGFDMSEICLLSSDGAQLTPVVQRGWPDHHPPAGQPADEGAAGQAVVQGRTLIIDDYQAWEHALDLHRETGIARSAAATPIRVGDRIAAVLTAATRTPRGVTSYERDCFELLAMQAGVALQHAHAFEAGRRQQAELARRANRDPLTGVANRTHVLDILRQRVMPGAATSVPCSVLFVDLDGFKQVNDSFGHHVGDRVLAAVAERIVGAVRPADVVARWGGDEFLVIIDHGGVGLDAITERVAGAISEPLAVEGRVLVPGASIGAATQELSDDPERLIARADAAMYEDKDARRR